MHSADEIRGWLVGRLPASWFVEPPEVKIDRDEILVVGRLEDAEATGGEGASGGAAAGGRGPDDARLAARAGRIERFREETREQRIRIAREAERHFGRTVSWGALCGDVRRLFTTLTVPAMTRLRFTERAVLDTLIDAGVARSRSDALAWCVRLVAANQTEWLSNLREAFAQVERVRAAGPTSPPAG